MASSSLLSPTQGLGWPHSPCSPRRVRSAVSAPRSWSSRGFWQWVEREGGREGEEVPGLGPEGAAAGHTWGPAEFSARSQLRRPPEDHMDGACVHHWVSKCWRRRAPDDRMVEGQVSRTMANPWRPWKPPLLDTIGPTPCPLPDQYSPLGCCDWRLVVACRSAPLQKLPLSGSCPKLHARLPHTYTQPTPTRDPAADWQGTAVRPASGPSASEVVQPLVLSQSFCSLGRSFVPGVIFGQNFLLWAGFGHRLVSFVLLSLKISVSFYKIREFLIFSSRKLEIPREHFMHIWAQ